MKNQAVGYLAVSGLRYFKRPRVLGRSMRRRYFEQLGLVQQI